ncbi:MAG: hypothetical protein JO102_01455, partial [Elusimicrobia bacterium]|nr:hypothetical protein [Elusimicrobiota bacterium]
MNEKLYWKLGILVAVFAWAIYMVYPNLVWYSLPLPERQAQAKRKNPLAKQAVPLGL